MRILIPREIDFHGHSSREAAKFTAATLASRRALADHPVFLGERTGNKHFPALPLLRAVYCEDPDCTFLAAAAPAVTSLELRATRVPCIPWKFARHTGGAKRISTTSEVNARPI